jgi:hypothetical protein
MPLTENNTGGSPTQDDEEEGGFLQYVELFATLGGALILALAFWQWYKTGKAPS